MNKQTEQQPALITRALVGEQVRARIAGKLSDAGLAAWAFDRFYAVELEREQLEPGAEVLIHEVLDMLMFADEPGFGMAESELRQLLGKLTTA